MTANRAHNPFAGRQLTDADLRQLLPPPVYAALATHCAQLTPPLAPTDAVDYIYTDTGAADAGWARGVIGKLSWSFRVDPAKPTTGGFPGYSWFITITPTQQPS